MQAKDTIIILKPVICFLLIFVSFAFNVAFPTTFAFYFIMILWKKTWYVYNDRLLKKL